PAPIRTTLVLTLPTPEHALPGSPSARWRSRPWTHSSGSTHRPPRRKRVCSRAPASTLSVSVRCSQHGTHRNVESGEYMKLLGVAPALIVAGLAACQTRGISTGPSPLAGDSTRRIISAPADVAPTKRSLQLLVVVTD